MDLLGTIFILGFIGFIAYMIDKETHIISKVITKIKEIGGDITVKWK